MNLFVTPPVIDPAEYGLTKVGSYRLSSPPSAWDDEITQLLVREHPYLPADRIVITFKKKDDASGSAYGFASISGNKVISIPIIVKNRELAPMDVVVRRTSNDPDAAEGAGDLQEDQVLPLNDGTYEMLDDIEPVGTVVDPHQDRSSHYTEDGSSLRLPFRGRTVIAEYLGASPSKVAALHDLLKSDKELIAGFVTNGTQEVINSWLSAPGARKTAQAVHGSQQLPRSIAQYLNAAPCELKTAEMLAADVIVEDGAIKSAVAADVVDLGSPDRGESRILIFEDGTYCSAPEKVATLQSGTADSDIARRVIQKVAANELRRGSTLMFQIGDAFTRPAKLASIMESTENGSVRFRLTDDLARSYDVFLDRRVKTASLAGGSWVLPMSSRVFEMREYAEAPAMDTAKVAEWFDRNLPDSLTCSDGQFTLCIRGEAFGVPQVSEAKVAEVLDSWFSNGDQLLAMARDNGVVRFSSALPGQVAAAVKLAQVHQRLPELGREVVSDLGMELKKAVKLAAALADPGSVDAVLSAGFLNEDNLAEFANLSNTFEDVVSKLARLLLAIRMGFPGDENATMVAMKSLHRVAEKLRSAAEGLLEG